MVTVVGLLLVAGLVFYAIAPEARDRLIRVVVGSIGLARQQATRVRPECERFRAGLRERTPRVVATPVLVALNLFVFVGMLLGGELGNADTLVGWGANSWLQTRNGEWWRLVTAIFAHSGLLHLLINLAGFVQISLILERLLGPAICVAVFLIAGVFGNLAHLVAHPMSTSTGASGAAYGLYGLLFSASFWGLRDRSKLLIPLTVIKQLSPAAAVFMLFNLVTDSVGSAGELTGLVVGLVCGAILTREVTTHKPASLRVAHATAAALMLAVLSAIPLRGVTDVRPEIDRAFATEEQTAEAYRKASEQFKNGQMTANALAGLIDEDIIPELHGNSDRLKALTGVPTSHQPLVAEAEEYVRLRTESWRLRAEWLRKAGKLPRRGNETAQHRANNRLIAEAEVKERAALEVLQKIQPSNLK